MTTTNKTQPVSQLQKLLEDLDFGTVRSYSGCGMFGKECLALTGLSEIGTLISFLVERAVELTEQGKEVKFSTIRALESIKIDDLGKDLVFYFPNTEYVQVEPNEETHYMNEEGDWRWKTK